MSKSAKVVLGCVPINFAGHECLPSAASHHFAPRSGREIALSTVLPFGLLDDQRIGSLLWVGEPVHCSLENGHCVASLTR